MRSCRWAREIGSLVVVALLPLVFNPYSKQPFELTKVVFFRWAVVALVSVFIVERLLLLGQKRSILKGNPLALPTLAYGGICVLATGLASSPRRSLWGSADKHGTATLLCTLAFFFLLSDILRTDRQTGRIIKAILMGTVPVTLYAVVQGIGLDPFCWVSDSVSPALSTMGRSNFLGAYLAMVVPFALLPIFGEKRALEKMRVGRVSENEASRSEILPITMRSAGFVLLVLALVGCVLLSQARAGWLALTVGLLIFFVMLARRRRNRTLWILSLFILVFGASGQVLLGHVRLTKSTGDPTGRFVVDAPYTELRAETVNSRAVIWRGTLAIIRGRWLLGYGPENFDSLYNSRYPPDMALGGLGMRVRDPHNLFLAHLVAMGVLGLAAFILLTGYFYFLTMRAFRLAANESDAALSAAILASAAAFLIQAQFNPDVLVTWVLYWVVLAMGTASPVSSS